MYNYIQTTNLVLNRDFLFLSLLLKGHYLEPPRYHGEGPLM